ncbi:hypothetical protein GGX14DRAFT_392462 [Mycena pura]|uniref:Uncharacterized protein n=1 Tax=Mycena pura TaxID=153505 RepID=A0AAD6YHR7_9AGAR|nr:hypothetical protein GGX14DRAFT_392462 [Mycena pura]
MVFENQQFRKAAAEWEAAKRPTSPLSFLKIYDPYLSFHFLCTGFAKCIRLALYRKELPLEEPAGQFPFPPSTSWFLDSTLSATSCRRVDGYVIYFERFLGFEERATWEWEAAKRPTSPLSFLKIYDPYLSFHFYVLDLRNVYALYRKELPLEEPAGQFPFPPSASWFLDSALSATSCRRVDGYVVYFERFLGFKERATRITDFEGRSLDLHDRTPADFGPVQSFIPTVGEPAQEGAPLAVLCAPAGILGSAERSSFCTHPNPITVWNFLPNGAGFNIQETTSGAVLTAWPFQPTLPQPTSPLTPSTGARPSLATQLCEPHGGLAQ